MGVKEEKEGGKEGWGGGGKPQSFFGEGKEGEKIQSFVEGGGGKTF